MFSRKINTPSQKETLKNLRGSKDQFSTFVPIDPCNSIKKKISIPLGPGRHPACTSPTAHRCPIPRPSLPPSYCMTFQRHRILFLLAHTHSRSALQTTIANTMSNRENMQTKANHVDKHETSIIMSKPTKCWTANFSLISSSVKEQN
jgi:hypothetical protein